ncbi:RNA polymerase I, largest subunit [Planoprotostelium fungivorum]|uniref:DNA-directed RNA polymerase subunit n=1 Tax=Planoprotostelium fungivorum TaxID=1890364 RepID=A0A2P6NZE4_9EUKA|nr:RNA polymerase I, largest subunit [Planoprotostelium fungivorum]
MSVVEITAPESYSRITGEPIKNGLYDLRMGPDGRSQSYCISCDLHAKKCPGHYGHIKMLAPLFNPLTFLDMMRLVKISCIFCHKLIQNRNTLYCLETVLAAIDYGLDEDAKYLLESTLARNLREKVRLIHQGKTKEAESFSIFHEVDKDSTLLNKEDKDGKDAKKSKKSKKEEDGDEDDTLPPPPIERMSTSAAHELRQKAVSQLYSVTFPKNCPNSKCNQPINKYRSDQERVKVFLTVRAMNTNKLNQFLRDEKYEKWIGERYPDMKRKEPFFQEKKNAAAGMESVLVTPQHLMYHLRELWANHADLFSYVFGVIDRQDGVPTRISNPDRFFVEYVPVPPNKYRPSNIGERGLLPYAQNSYYADIINLNPDLDGFNDHVNMKLVLAQSALNTLYDNRRSHDKKAAPGISQILEKKEGLFRKNMMGKRVNFACRTVISPDPYLQTNQMGIPPYFAERLTYPEPVTERNYKEMAAAVVNGPHKHPGALAIEDEKGRVINLQFMSEDERRAQSMLLRTFHEDSDPHSIKKVYRHVRDGDVVLTNRQPTLHKPSIMAHFVKVLKSEKTLRMHYANCNTFNADFDGDEMNVHLPQDPLARAEAQTIAMADYQYITARNGGPLRGLIQDHVVTGVLLTMRDTFLELPHFTQIVYSAVLELNYHEPVVIPTPAVLRPKRLWTGKQVVSTVLKQIVVGKKGLNLNAKAKVPDRMWGPDSGEGDVIFRDNDLLTGVLDKSAFGASGYGLVHACYEIYGGVIAGQLLSCLSRLFTIYLQDVGFSCGMDDLLLAITAEEKRAELLLEANSIGVEVAQAYVKKEKGEEGLNDPDSLKHLLRNDKGRAALDNMMKSKTHPFSTQIVDHCLPDGQLKRFPHNYLSMMTVSGAKGASVNHSQISCLLGQQELEGRRVPVMQSGKTLPSFDAFDTSSRAGGYIADRFLTGIKPQEYFFHCMAGREGLVDTAVKTSRSGYLQRCLIKHMEGLKVCYDNTVRDADGSIIQFFYGEDGIDVMNTAFLEKFTFQAQNYNALKELHWPQKTAAEEEGNSTVSPLTDEHAKKLQKRLDKQKKQKEHLMDPIMSQISPQYNIGSTSEKFFAQLADYCERNPDKLIKSDENKKGVRAKSFKTMSLMKYYHSLAHAGEAVGLVAAQSIGEPSTQMTLNTFHLAGRGDVNVTLGIPRLRELLMTGSRDISTPGMNLPLHNGATEKDAENLCKKLARVQLSEVVLDIIVVEKFEMDNTMPQRTYDVTVQFKSENETLSKHDVSYKQIKAVTGRVFLRSLHEAVKKMSSVDSNSIVTTVSTAMSKRADHDAAAVLAEDAEDLDEKSKKGRGKNDDLSDRKKDSKKKDMATYDEDDEEREEEEEAEEKEEKEEEEEGKEKLAVEEKLHYVQTSSFDASKGIFHVKFSIPASQKKSLMLTLVEEQLNVTPVHLVEGIQKAVVVKGKNNQFSVATEGINFPATHLLQEYFDVTRVTCNQPHAMNDTYGIESGRHTIANEISNVFGVYGIAVDFRHLSLIADYMTKSGSYKAMNRSALLSNPSMYQKASFESTLMFIAKGTMSGDSEMIRSPSAGIVLGKVVEVGTGTFECYQPILSYAS